MRLLALTILLAPLALRAQSPKTLFESFTKANVILDAAIAAHGGVDALRAARQVRVTLDGYEYHRMQSRRIAPPYDSTRYRLDLMIDLAKGRLVVDGQTRGYPGGFYYTNRFISAGTKHFAVDVRNQTYTNEQYPPAEQQLGNLFRLPQFMLLAAHERVSPGARRWLGRLRVPSGATVDVVSFAVPNGSLTLGFDPSTHRLQSEMSIGYDPMVGETEVVTEYVDYRTTNGILLPSRRVVYRGGEVISRQRFAAVTPGYEIPDSLLAPPSSFGVVTPMPAVDPVRELAPGVWAIGPAGGSALLVAFSDHLLVVDGPPRLAPEIITRAATLAPGKPIRYVVPTHHHDDHFFGARHFAAAGATVVTTPGNVEYAKRVMAAPKSGMLPGAVDPVSSARIEAISGKRRVFSDGTRTVEIHDVGPNGHAEEMLVAWLPAEGILFQADLLEIPRGVATRGSNAQATLQFADFVRAKQWTVRTLVGAHGTAASPAELEALARLPVLPPD